MSFIKKSSVAVVAAVSFVQFGAVSAQDLSLDTDEKKYSYAVGTRLAQQLLQQFGGQDGEMDMQSLAAGITDAVTGAELKMTNEEAIAAIDAKQQARLAAALEEANAAGEKGNAYREENAKKDGVTQTDSGLQYTVINSGDESGKNPSAESTVMVHYRGTLIDGTEFDSSYSRGEPATFSLTGIIPGWGEALQLMRPGDKWSVVIPPELAYGQRGAGPQIGPNETLIFEIELLEIK
ncbi:MAG: FKBP-type peptidyl-prolyl cis-trans isomerase [Acidiferrobacterales bacterium]|nr:FKBP-type peptidyl-prolyl cis-trans isomerase [Acidiferrobacterales bacterium]